MAATKLSPFRSLPALLLLVFLSACTATGPEITEALLAQQFDALALSHDGKLHRVRGPLNIGYEGSQAEISRYDPLVRVAASAMEEVTGLSFTFAEGPVPTITIGYIPFVATAVHPFALVRTETATAARDCPRRWAVVCEERGAPGTAARQASGRDLLQ